MPIRLAHPPDPDSAFAFHGLAAGKVDRRGLEIEITVQDLAGLNDLACRKCFEATVVSAHAYGLVACDYALSSAGGIFGHDTGPVVISAEPIQPSQIAQLTVATAATTTSAYLAYSLLSPALRTMVLPGDKLIAAVQTGLVPCALVAHTNRMTAALPGLHEVIDLGKWWCSRNKPLPMPLHVTALRRDLDPSCQQRLVAVIRDSVRFGLANPVEALVAAERFSPIDGARLRDHVLGCVTEMSLDMGQLGRSAIDRFLSQGDEAALLFAPQTLDVID
ncbi:MAG: MqnA/MqnD/SBP family protein [Phycisphaerae bacterium]